MRLALLLLSVTINRTWDFCSIRCSSAFDEDSESKRKGKARKRKFNGEAEVCTNPKSEDFEDAPYEDGHAR